MATIDEILDAATPSEAAPPTLEQLRSVLGRRSRRRRAAVLATGCVVLALVGMGVVAGIGTGQRVESIDEPPVGDDDRGAPAVPTTTTIEERAVEEATTSTPMWATRWFLVPPEPIEIRRISSQPSIWDEAQGATIGGLFVTTDPQRSATAGLAHVYHLDDASIFRIGSPDWNYYEKTISGRQVRVGNDPNGDRINAFVASGSGSFVVVGVGLTDEQAIDLVLAAQLVDGETQLGAQLPAAFTEVAEIGPDPTDHRTTIGWQDGGAEFLLSISRTRLEEQVLNNRSDEADAVPLRKTIGVYTATQQRINPASLIWAEDGYAFVLATTNDQEPGDLEGLVAAAESLQRIDQRGLIERLRDPFMARQATIIADWLTATPPPSGWDTTSLVNSVPQHEATVTGFVRQFLECTWTAEWSAAVRTDDSERRNTAQAVLATQTDWPVFQAEMETLRRLGERFADRVEQVAENIDIRTRRMESVQTLEQLAEYERDQGCGFIAPPP